MSWNWFNHGGIVRGAIPAAVSWGPNRLDVFARGRDGALWQRWWGGSRWDWYNHGGSISAPSKIAAVTWGINRLDVFVLWTDGSIRQRWWDGSNWGGWFNHGAPPPGLDSSPAVISWGPNRLDVFAIGRDFNLWQRWWDGSRWNDWYSHGNGGIPFLSAGGMAAPAAVTWGYNRLDVFAAGRDANLYQRWWNGTQWNWTNQGGGPQNLGFPAAISWSPGRLDIFDTGRDGSLQQRWWDGSNWGGWLSHGGSLSVDHPVSLSAVTWGPNRLDVFAINHDYSLVQRWWGGSRWDWYNHGGYLTTLLTAVTWGPDRLDVFAVDRRDSSLQQRGWEATTSPTPPPTPPPSDTRVRFDFILTGDWTRFITSGSGQVYVAVAPPGTDPSRATHHTMVSGITGWTTSVPATAGRAGIWTFRCHVRGARGDGTDTGDIWSPVYTYNWEFRSPAAYISLDTAGTGIGTWSLSPIWNG